MTIRSACVFSMLLVACCPLLVACCQSVAGTDETRPPLNPKNAGAQPHRIDISAHDWGGNLKRFYVIIRAKDAKIPLEVGAGYLKIQDGNKFVCGCQVKPEPKDGAVWFEFTVAPEYLETSGFSFSVATTTAEERKKLGSEGGWESYQFTLKEFVSGSGKNAAQPGDAKK